MDPLTAILEYLLESNDPYIVKLRKDFNNWTAGPLFAIHSIIVLEVVGASLLLRDFLHR